jgi:toxin ParE1/3/4
MVRLRISGPAREDLEHILATSLERWGKAGRARYAALLAAAMRAIAHDPEGSTTRTRAELLPGVRSLHIRHARGARGVKDPVHVIFYRVTDERIEVVRVLHERMEPSLHVERPRTGRRRR